MKVVVTGAAGMIGSNLVHGLNAIGVDDIIAVDNLTNGPKFSNLVGAQISDYFDKTEFYARFARREFGLIGLVDVDRGECGGGEERQCGGQKFLEHGESFLR